MTNSKSPVAKRILTKQNHHNDEVHDYYAWLRDQAWPKFSNPEIMDYINKENEYYDNFKSHYKNLIDKVYNEIHEKADVDIFSSPFLDGDYYYYRYMQRGQQYYVHARYNAISGNATYDVSNKSVSNIDKNAFMERNNKLEEATSLKELTQLLEKYNVNVEILLDENLLAKSQNYFKLGTLTISPDQNTMAYAIDYIGNERYTVFVKSLIKSQLKPLNQYTQQQSYIDATNSGNKPNHLIQKFLIQKSKDKELEGQESNNILPSAPVQLQQSIMCMGSDNNIIWAQNKNDVVGFFYIPAESDWKSKKVLYHKLGTPVEDDNIIYEEKDEKFRVHLERSETGSYLFINTSSKDSSEVYYLRIDDKTNIDFTQLNDTQVRDNYLIKLRQNGVMYSATHMINSASKNDSYVMDSFILLTNEEAPNFKIIQTSINNAVDKKLDKNWQEIIGHSPNQYLKQIYAFKDNLVLLKSIDGCDNIDIIDYNTLAIKNKLSFSDPIYDINIVYTTFAANKLRYKYSSLRIPQSTIAVDLNTGASQTLQVMETNDQYIKDDYNVLRLHATSTDGIKIPISLIYKNYYIDNSGQKVKFYRNGNAPLLLYGYGAYGITVHSNFRNSIFSLLDRGFVYAIAHVRGGDELGRIWYENGKLLNKNNTFTDFITVGKFLIQEGYTNFGNISIHGGSAGGMLVGNVMNSHPNMFKSVIANVPFVDVLNTMLDSSLPLTTGEYLEWGNPNVAEYYNYIKSYSPYNNIKEQAYPALFVQTALEDQRVTYWEPLKWIAELRYHQKGNNPILLKIDKEAGHGGSQSKEQQIKSIAESYGFVLYSHGITN